MVMVKIFRNRDIFENERRVCETFQDRSPYIRQVIDKIPKSLDPPIPSCLVLEQFMDDLWSSSNRVRLNRMEIKYVATRILEALRLLHGFNMIHTGIEILRCSALVGND
jgi:hypothetical protein